MLSEPFSADLHMHSTASDGCLSPKELIRCAAQKGLCCAALTDHDSVAGIHEALEAGKEYGVRVFKGVELSAGDDGETHILGLGDSVCPDTLNALLKRMQNGRIVRARKIAAKLLALGVVIDIDSLIAQYAGHIGRPHIARELLHVGAVKTFQEAFDRYIGSGSPAYEQKEPLTVTDAIHTLLRAHMVPVLAHPGLMQRDAPTLNALLDVWQAEGLLGLEAYHYANRQERGCEFYERLARTRGLLVTGGSDFHCEGDGHAALGEMAPLWTRAESDVEALTKAMAELEAT